MHYSEDIKTALNIAQSIAKEFSNDKFSPAHLLKALLHKDVGLTDILMALDQDILYLEEWADVRIESYPKKPGVIEKPPGDDLVTAVFREAEVVCLKLSGENVDALSVLIALSTPGVGFSFEQLKTFTLNPQMILDYVLDKKETARITGSTDTIAKLPEKSSGALLKFCKDKNELAIRGELDPVVGRDNEIRKIAEILGRRYKSNVLILGDPGVGKTALVNGFTQRIVEKGLSSGLSDTIIFELDYGSLIAGASYKGEIEERLKKIITEIQNFPKAILFIDDLHVILDKQGGSSGAGNLLKPALARNELTIIGTSSVDNYTKYIEIDEAFNRQFEKIGLDEPGEELSLRMIRTIMPRYEEHHNLHEGDEVISEAIR